MTANPMHKPLRVFIPSKDRATTITTPDVFAGADCTVVVHTEAQRMLYALAGRCDRAQLIVSNTAPDAYGLTRQREFIMNTLVEKDEWFVFADDNITRLTAVGPAFYWGTMTEAAAKHSGRAIFKQVCPLDWFNVIAGETIGLARQVGAKLCGFAVVDNPMFRTTKFRTVGYVSGKLMLMQQNPLPFDHTITMEDFANTAAHLLEYGAVVINNWLFPVARHYQAGGMGKYAERVPYRRADVVALLAKYPGLFKVKARDGFEPDTDLGVQLTKPEQVARWRHQMQKQMQAEGG